MSVGQCGGIFLCAMEQIGANCLDEEAKSLNENCEYFRKFLESIADRGTRGLSSNSVVILDKFKEDIRKFACSDDTAKGIKSMKENLVSPSLSVAKNVGNVNTEPTMINE